MSEKSNKFLGLVKLVVALFVTYYALNDISNMLVGDFDPDFSMSLYLVSNFFMFILIWSLVFKPADKIKVTAFIVFALIASSMSFYNQEISTKLDMGDCYAAQKSWDTDENRCRYDCASWTKEEGCAKMFDVVDEIDEEIVE